MTVATVPDYGLFLRRQGGLRAKANEQITAFINALTPGVPVRLPDFGVFRAKSGNGDAISRTAKREGILVSIRKFGDEQWVCHIHPEDEATVKALNFRRKKASNNGAH